MQWARLKASIEAYGIRGRAYVRLAVGVVGIGIVVLGAINLLTVSGIEPGIGSYRALGGEIVQIRQGVVIHTADVVLIAVGAIIAWLA